MIHFLIQISCDGCKATFEHGSDSLFKSTSEAESAAFKDGWEKNRWHNMELFCCPTCQAAGKKYATGGAA